MADCNLQIDKAVLEYKNKLDEADNTIMMVSVQLSPQSYHSALPNNKHLCDKYIAP